MPGKAVPEMIYTVSGGTLKPTHSLGHSFRFVLFQFNSVALYVP